MKRKNNKLTKRTIQRQLDYVSGLVISNKKTIEMLGDFLYNYLKMKGETEEYTKFMEKKIDGLIQESGTRDGEIPREPIQEKKKEG
tara:strand:- start:137 stop:394 length:258 start_codon:yes stop_codon:yes gene_type:complete